jgi:hypothetical protein
MKNPRMLEQMFSIANRYTLTEEATPDTKEQKESGHQTSSAHPRATTRRESQTVLSMRWSGLVVIRSTDPGQMNSKASWIIFAFSTPRECARPKTTTDSKVSQMRFSRRPSRPIKKRSLRILRATSPRCTRRSTISLVALTHLSRQDVHKLIGCMAALSRFISQLGVRGLPFLSSSENKTSSSGPRRHKRPSKTWRSI